MQCDTNYTKFLSEVLDMKKISTVLAAGAMVLGATTAVYAKDSALVTATNASACGDVAPISARYLDSGLLEVTCPSGSVTQQQGAAAGGLGAGAAAGFGLLGLLAIAGNGSSSTTTTGTR
jgi:hypothetical protein